MKSRWLLLVVAAMLGAGLVPGPASAVTSHETVVGRWQQSRTCDDLVRALEAQGLGSLAPGVVGDYFPGQTPEELAAKPDICTGALPQLHSHFFAPSGAFGSLDRHRNQVDDGTYVIVDANTLRIGDATFDYAIRANHLKLAPVITGEQRQEALRHAWDFTTAGWMVSVAMQGTSWDRVACGGWC